MRDIFWNQDFTLMEHYKGILEEAGIACFIRDESSLAALQVMPGTMSLPVLCISNDEDYDRARTMIRELVQTPSATLPDWKCANCGETVPGNFDSCWHCGTPRAT